MSMYILRESVVRPAIEAPHLELKPVMFHMLQTIGQFHGLVKILTRTCDALRQCVLLLIEINQVF